MKKAGLFLFIAFFVLSCNDNKKNNPDVSGIKVEVKVERFDKDFFAIDSNNVLAGLNQLYEKYPLLTPIFLQNILGLDSASTLAGVKQFLALSQPIRDTVNDVFNNTDRIQKDFEKAFRFVKYYFPQYKIPKLTPGFLGISLQFYLGNTFSVYRDPFFIENVAPEYRSRRFSKEYIIGDAMQLIVDDLFPDNSSGKPLIERMIEKGKQWWLLDKFLPETADSIKTGYTQQQLDWCNKNEGLIWNYLIKTEKDLYSVNPTIIQTYIGEGPFTQGLSQELSPGNIGQWIGWRIVQKFAANNSGMKPEEVMNTPAKKILDEAKYKPK